MNTRFPIAMALCLSSLLPLTALAEPTLKGTAQELKSLLLEQHNVISIIGESEMDASADRAVITLLIKTKESLLKTALDRNQRIRQSMLTKLQEKGIKAEDIQFSRFSNTPNYGFFSDKPSSYEITNEVKITITREELLSDIAAIVDAQDEVYFVNSSVEHSLKEKFKQQALSLALENAVSKRALYEKLLGMKLKPVKVTEQHVDVMPIRIMEKSDKLAYSSAMGTGAEMQRNFGELKYRARVDVEFIAQ